MRRISYLLALTVLPHRDDRVVVRTAAGERTEGLGRRSSYTYQWEAFAARVRHGAPLPIDATTP